MSEPKNYISCNVSNCAYNDEQCHCTAGEVVVGQQFCNSTAQTSDETVCSTFYPRNATNFETNRFEH